MLDCILFLERCRQCRRYIEEPRSSPAFTVCHLCWQEIDFSKISLEYCPISPQDSIAVASAAPYEGLVRSLIHKLKYDDDRLIAADLVILLERSVELLLNDKKSGDAILVPVPLSFWREFKRGFNQTDLLARKLSKTKKLKVDKKMLKRRKHTRAQHTMTKMERLENLKQAFAANKTRAQQKNVILVDDIYTSGATLAEAARTLLKAGAHQVSALTIARALLD